MTERQSEALAKWRLYFPNRPLPRLKPPHWPDETKGQKEMFWDIPFQPKPIRFYCSNGYALWRGCERDIASLPTPKKRRR